MGQSNVVGIKNNIEQHTASQKRSARVMYMHIIQLILLGPVLVEQPEM